MSDNTYKKRRPTRYSDTRSRKASKSSKLLIAQFFCLVIPALIALIALIQSTTTESPENTTAKFMNEHASQYLHVVAEKYNLNMRADEMGANAAELTPTGSLTDSQIFDILGLDAKNSEMKDGKLRSTLSSGQTLSISDKSVTANYCYFKVYEDGHIRKVWRGYNSQTETNVSIAGKKRTMEELATIAMIADSVEEIGANYTHANISGSTGGIWWYVFCAYLLGELVVLLCVWLWKIRD